MTGELSDRQGRKNYVLDTNVLIENPQSVLKLRNGVENAIHIPYHVLMELEALKKTPKLRHIVAEVIRVLGENRESIHFIQNDKSRSAFTDIVDNHILDEIEASSIEDPVLVTNDRILLLQAGLRGIKSEELRDSKPFESESQRYTGFVEEGEELVPNCFTWNEGKPVLHSPGGDRVINYACDVWNVRPRTIYQNLALELILDPRIDLVSIQSEAGYGKTFLALASALFAVQEKKALRQDLRPQTHHRDRGQAGLSARRRFGKDGAVREVRLRSAGQAPPLPGGQQGLLEPQ